MIWLLVILPLAGFVWATVRGAPYVPTLRKQAELALDLLDLKAGERFIDLGAGDGQLIAAAARRGIHATGYEINPLLCVVAWLRCLPYKHTKIIYGDYWNNRLVDCEGIFIFGIQRIMPRLERKLKTELKKGSRVVCFAFELPNKKAIRQQNGLFLYRF